MTSFTHTITTAYNTMLTLDRFKRWPDPASSIGASDPGIPFHGKTLWNMEGPALIAYRTIEHLVDSCLSELGTDLYAFSSSSTAGVPHSVAPYMRGWRKSNANPYLVISCSEISVSQIIKTTIQNHDWWKIFKQNHSGFGRFLLSLYPPRPFGADDGNSRPRMDDVWTVGPIRNLYSVPLVFPNASSSDRNFLPIIERCARATLGGVVYVDGKPYGTTAAHALNNEHPDEPPTEQHTPEDGLFYIDDDDDDDDDNHENDHSEVESDLIVASDTLTIESQHFHSRSIHDESRSLESDVLTPFGTILSFAQEEDNADWAFIGFGSLSDVSTLLARRRIVLGKLHHRDGDESYIYAPRVFAALPQATQSVFMFDRFGTLIRGSLGASHSTVWLAGSSQYIHLATVLVREPLKKGDCGTWVFDQDGNLYGHIVAGMLGTGIVYLRTLLPMENTFRSTFGTTPTKVSLIPDETDKSTMMTAVSNGYWMDVEHLLGMGVNASAQYPGDSSLLFKAAEKGFEQIVQILLQTKADVEQGDGRSTPLIIACKWKHEGIVRLLLEYGARIEAVTQRGETPLYMAILQRDPAIVRLLLDYGAKVNVPAGRREFVLYTAARLGDEAIVRMLLAAGADINAQNFYGNALQGASSNGHCEVVRLLLDEGAEVNTQAGHFGDALENASSKGHDDVVRLLVERGADVNAQSSAGSALQNASANGHLTTAQLLIDLGADVNLHGGPYNNALQVASMNGHREVVQLLLDEGAEVNTQGGYYGNALQGASTQGNLEVVQLLLDSGADVNARGGCYGTALMAASARGHREIVQLLRRVSAGVDTQEVSHDSAL